jgi:rRNA maturation endonuclease Nob1
MILLSFEGFVLAYILAGLAVILGMWLYYDRRDRNLYDTQRHRHVFHCVKCGKLYERGGDDELADCPQCGFWNDRLRF